MLLRELLFEGDYLYVSDPRIFSEKVHGIWSDSRKICEGDVFVCLKGIHTDGLLHIFDAQKRGAVLVICENSTPLCPLPFVIVKNARRILSLMLYRFYGEPTKNMKLFAVTGTNGKTSTCIYLNRIFHEAGIKTAYIGTLKPYIGTERFYLGDDDDESISTMTTPDPEQLYKILYNYKKVGVEHAVIEASSHALRLDKLYPLRFFASALLNISPEHMDFHGDMGSYLLSKCKIFNMSDRVLICADDNMCFSAKGVFDTEVSSFGIYNPDADIMAQRVRKKGLCGIEYTLKGSGSSFNISCKVPGEFTVYNTLAAASMALCAGISPEVISSAIENTEHIDGRMEKLDLGRYNNKLSVIIDYAHTEAALKNILGEVASVKDKKQRIVTVFGCGGDRDKEKRAPMARAASLYSDIVIITEDNSRNEDPDGIIKDILAGIDSTKEYVVIKNRKKAIEYAIENAQEGDIILLVGKGHESYEINGDEKRPFSEKKIVYEYLGIDEPED